MHEVWSVAGPPATVKPAGASNPAARLSALSYAADGLPRPRIRP